MKRIPCTVQQVMVPLIKADARQSRTTYWLWLCIGGVWALTRNVQLQLDLFHYTGSVWWPCSEDSGHADISLVAAVIGCF